MATVLSLQPGPTSSTRLGGPLPQKVAKVVDCGINGISLTSTSVCPHPSPSSLLLHYSPSSGPCWLTFHHLLAPAHLPPDTQMLSPKLGADHASALKLYGTEDPSGNRKAVYTIPRKMHTPHNWYAIGCGPQGAHDTGPRGLHRGVRLPSTEDASTAP